LIEILQNLVNTNLERFFWGWRTFRNWALTCTVLTLTGLALMIWGPDWLRVIASFLILGGIFGAMFWVYCSVLFALQAFKRRILRGFYEDGGSETNQSST